jgi:hypothetical protein
MSWLKKGMVFKPAGQGGWMNSHAAAPTVLVKEDRLRIYFASRPVNTLSMPSFIDVDIRDPSRILYVNEKPLLECGRPGTFDEFGVVPSCVITCGELVYLYTSGWSRGQTVPYVIAIGFAVSEDGGATFRRRFDGPIVDRTAEEPYSAMAPFILRRDGIWHMWYGSGIDWVQPAGKYEPIYIIKYAHSADGIRWEQPNITCIPGKTVGEANTRPSVVWDNGLYRMWFCYRGSEDFRGGKGSYRIGYAESADGKQWTRLDEKVGIAVSAEGWDSEMLTYPQVVDTPIGRLLFYDGNGFGASGFGYAIWEKTAA